MFVIESRIDDFEKVGFDFIFPLRDDCVTGREKRACEPGGNKGFSWRPGILSAVCALRAMRTLTALSNGVDRAAEKKRKNSE